METVRIARVRTITHGKTINGVAKPLNIVVIDLANGKEPIVRSFAQFLEDLKGSHLINGTVKSINHPAVNNVLRGLKRGIVSGEIAYHKKGEKWTVSETSSIVTDPTHPEYGTANVGDTRTYEKDFTRVVDGFLDFETNEQHQTVQAVAEATAQAKLAMQDMFEDFGIKVNASDDDDADEAFDEIPSDAIASAVAPAKKGK